MHNNQLQPFAGASSNSANSSPMKRVPPAVSPLASPMESRRLFAASGTGSSASGSSEHPQHPALLQLGYSPFPAPQPARLLVDPHTGQQFFVPAAGPSVMPQGHPHFYQPTPLFYNQPAYYPVPTSVAPGHHHPGYVYASQPPPQHSPHHQAPPTTLWSAPSLPIVGSPRHSAGVPSPPPQHRPQHSSSGAYRVELPPSTAASVAGGAEPEEEAEQHNFQRRQHARLSTESRSSATGQHSRLEHHSIAEDSLGSDGRSPPPLSSGFSASYQHYPAALPRLLNPDHHSTGGSTGSSESTSGFASGRDRGPRSPPQSPTHSLREQRPRFPSDGDYGAIAPQPHRRAVSPKSPPPPPPPPPRMKAIRMDIDLNRPSSPPEQSQVSVRVSSSTAVLRTAPPTAFTISFTDAPDTKTTQTAPSIAGSGVRELSLQEAARQAPTGRRLMGGGARRSVPQSRAAATASAGADSGSEAGGDPKRWLFRKMMQGRDQKQQQKLQQKGQKEVAPGHEPSPEGDADAEADEDADRASEAGTYVVESSRLMSQSQLTAATSASSGGTLNARRQRRKNRSGTHSGSSSSSCSTSTATSSGTASNKTPSPIPPPPVADAGARAKRSLMSDLRRLREQKQTVESPRVVPPRAPMPQRKGQLPQLPVVAAQPPPVPPRPCRQLSTALVDNRKPNSSAFRPQSTGGASAGSSSRCRSEPRTDGGRFSMRPARGKPVAQPPLQIRQSLGTAPKGVAPQQQPKPKQSPEMVAWLRRKEYDPRKEAAAAKAAREREQQLKQQLLRLAPLALPEECNSSVVEEEQEVFMANRSLSTSATASGAPASPFARWRQQQAAELRGSHGHRSHDDLSRLGESMDEESLLGTGGADSCSSTLQRMVDELTQKCHKSITLLKLCNQSGLSASVEQLLERVVDSGGAKPDPQNAVARAGGEDISDRLERLSSAFDAIQKYLEEQTTSVSSSRGSLAALTGTKMPSPEGTRKVDGGQ